MPGPKHAKRWSSSSVYKVVIVGLVGVLAAGLTVTAEAESFVKRLRGGDSVTIEADGCELQGSRQGANKVEITCVAPSGSATNPASGPPPVEASQPGEKGRCGEALHTWHPPVVNGCATGHEHGDAPPAWIASAGLAAHFVHDASTPRENELKHTSFKGFHTTLKGVELYGVFHQDFHPNGHTARFHSYQVFARDPSGNVSHWQGWLDYGVGDNTGPNLVRVNCPEDDTVRPVMLVNSPGCGPVEFETWYSRPGGSGLWSWDMGFTNKATYFALPAGATNNQMTDSGSWRPTGKLNDVRRVEMSWYADRSTLRGTFWTTQFGKTVSGPDDPVCGTSVTVGAKSYETLCLEQHIASTMPSVVFPGNSEQKEFGMDGVTLPN